MSKSKSLFSGHGVFVFVSVFVFVLRSVNEAIVSIGVLVLELFKQIVLSNPV